MFIPTEELMTGKLSLLLDDDKQLRYPFYGTLLEVGAEGPLHTAFCYFALSESALLAAEAVSEKILGWSARLELDNIKHVRFRKSVIPAQHILTLELFQGASWKFRVSEKLVGNNFPNQRANVLQFLDELSELNETIG